MLNKATDIFMNRFLSTGEVVLKNIDKLSFQACLLVGFIALILSIFGYDKGKKVALISPAVYIIIQIFLEVWFGI